MAARPATVSSDSNVLIGAASGAGQLGQVVDHGAHGHGHGDGQQQVELQGQRVGRDRAAAASRAGSQVARSASSE